MCLESSIFCAPEMQGLHYSSWAILQTPSVTYFNVHFLLKQIFTYLGPLRFCFLCKLPHQERISVPALLCDSDSSGCTLPHLHVCNPGIETYCMLSINKISFKLNNLKIIIIWNFDIFKEETTVAKPYGKTADTGDIFLKNFWSF